MTHLCAALHCRSSDTSIVHTLTIDHVFMNTQATSKRDRLRVRPQGLSGLAKNHTKHRLAAETTFSASPAPVLGQGKHQDAYQESGLGPPQH